MENFEAIKNKNKLFNIINKQTGKKISDKDYTQVKIENYGIVATTQIEQNNTYDIFNNSGKLICSFKQQITGSFSQTYEFKFDEKYFEVMTETYIYGDNVSPGEITNNFSQTHHYYDYNGKRIACDLVDEKLIIEKDKYLIVYGYNSTDTENEEPLFVIYDTETQKTVFNSVGIATIFKNSLININTYNTLCFKKLYMESIRKNAHNFVNRYFEIAGHKNHKDVVLNDIDGAIKKFEDNISKYRFAKISSKIYDKLQTIISPNKKQKELLNVYNNVDLMLKALDTQEVISKGFIHQLYNEKTDEIELAVNYFDGIANQGFVNKILNSFDVLNPLLTNDEINSNIEKAIKNYQKDSWLIKFNFKNEKFSLNSECMDKIHQLELDVIDAYNNLFNKSVKVLDEEDIETL